MPVYSGQAAHFCIIDIPCRLQGKNNTKFFDCATVWYNAVFTLQYKPIRDTHYGTPLQLQDVSRQPLCPEPVVRSAYPCHLQAAVEEECQGRRLDCRLDFIAYRPHSHACRGGKAHLSLIYLARVSEKLTFAEYWEKYPAKRPVYTDDTSVLERYGDNIYKPVEGGFEQIRNVHHTDKNMAKDLRGQYVLVCSEFYYFSCLNPLTIPAELRPRIPKGQHPTGCLTENPEAFIRYVAEHR